jgi:hypothetical protein
MLWEFPLKVQSFTTSDQEWSEKIFQTKDEFLEYMWKQFKLPGKYNLTVPQVKKFQEAGLFYTETQRLSGKPAFKGGRYHNHTPNTTSHRRWKDDQKNKILNGVIIDDVYFAPFHYWYSNYCPIYDDIAKKTRFGDVWDTDVWYFQYVMLCLLMGRNVIGVKGRQKGFSFKHMALLYWNYSWFGGSINTIGAYDKDLTEKSWRFLETYRNHINTNTTWKRGPVRAKSLEWEDRIELKNGGFDGSNSILKGVTFQQSATKDVGGNQSMFNYEEPGVSPTLLETYEFIKPAIIKGSITAGIFIACGSVGNLDQAEGLRVMFYDIYDYNGLGIPNIWDDDALPEDRCGIFVSEAYSMIGTDIHTDEHGKVIGGTGRPFIDAAGNSDVELALQWIKLNNEKLKSSKKKAHLKQIGLSQKCTSPKQAFAQRNTSEFPLELLEAQKERIKLKYERNNWVFKPQVGHLYEDEFGKVKLRDTDAPEMTYPVSEGQEDKRGWVTIYEPPDENPATYTYFAGLDPVEADDAVGSESLVSMHVFKTTRRVKYLDKEGREKFRIEGDKIVATYYGRFRSVEQTNEQCWFLTKMYNAFVYAERSKPNFINYMLRNGRHHYLAKESDVPFFKDLNLEGNGLSGSKYGFITTAQNEMWKHIKSYIKEYLRSEYGYETITRSDGTEEVIKIYRGVDRIDDYWLLEELTRYVEKKGNYDKIVSFGAVLIIAKTYQQNRIGIQEVSEIKKPEVKQVIIKKAQSLLGGWNKSNYNMLSGNRKNKSLLG